MSVLPWFLCASLCRTHWFLSGCCGPVRLLGLFYSCYYAVYFMCFGGVLFSFYVRLRPSSRSAYCPPHLFFLLWAFFRDRVFPPCMRFNTFAPRIFVRLGHLGVSTIRPALVLVPHSLAALQFVAIDPYRCVCILVVSSTFLVAIVIPTSCILADMST